MAEWQSGLFGLPCGADFAAGFADGLLARFAGQPPEALARVTIFVNAGKTLTALRDALIARGPSLLPRLRLINDIGGGAQVSPLARRLELGRLVDAALSRQPDLAQGQSVPRLAASLAHLMGEMQEEGLDAQALDLIDVSEHAQHWGRALAFLKIATGFYLGEPVDAPARMRQKVEELAQAWAEGIDLPQGPIIVAGSTGSRGATRDFMRAVAKLPNGAVVLPGYDFHQPASVWRALDVRSEDHPQARFAPLIAEFGPAKPWIEAPAPSEARNRLFSLALRPAPVTDQWIADGPALGDLVTATEGVTLIEADQPGQEAEAIALLLREAVERGQEVSLVSADRLLARRVTAALDRWRIIPDDSAGQPLALTSSGLFLRHVGALFGQPLTVDALLVLLKHPITNSGSGDEVRRQHQIQTRDLELQLRQHGPAFPTGDFLRDWGTKRGEERKLWTDWLAPVMDQIAAWAEDRAPRPLAARLSNLEALAQALAAGPEGSAAASRLWQGRDGKLSRATLDHLERHAEHGHAMPPGEFADLLFEELSRQAVREDVIVHPLIHFRGPREARTENAPLVILAGLNEGGWPQALEPDPWLSRPMRLAAGLTLPERRIGLSAHDFQQAAGRPQIVLTRAKRDAEAETIPSRWLNRLVNLLGGLPDQNGKAALSAMRARGDEWLALAALQAEPRFKTEPARRPSPIPPAPALTEMSVTEVQRLIRDPYAVYARRVLGLNALPPMRAEPDPASRGTVLHKIVEEFLKTNPSASDSVPKLRDLLLEKTDKVLAEEVPWPSARLFWRARIAGIADRLMGDEAARLAAGSQPVVVESRGSARVEGQDFVLTAKPDRIDVLPDGRAQIYDYKSGKPPSEKQIKLFDKQLPLEAAMVQRGAFDKIGPVEAAGISFIQLGGEGKTEPRPLDPGFVEETWQGFVTLIGKYLSGERGFTARLAMEQTGFGSDYDHLSRLGEWSMTEEARPEYFDEAKDG